MSWIPHSFRPGGRERVQSVEDGMNGQDGISGSTFGVPPTQSRRGTVAFVPDDQLSTFRHMVGIHSTRSLGTATATGLPDNTHNNLHFEGRAAPNLGIYNRVVHREQEAKRGYKYSSLLINGCLGLQVIVAAALTAMGAAKSNHNGVTVFGAVNTVIAGLLTYLKGSGLPNRLRYYENEWKKVREYIEQRERDFSHPNCRLDVYEVVHQIELMYEDVKADVHTNTPDSYVSVSDLRNRVSATNPQIPKMNEVGGGLGGSGVGKKLQELELKYSHKIADVLEGLAHKEEERLKDLEGKMAAEKARAMGVGRDLEKSAESKVNDAKRDVEKELEAEKSRVTQTTRDLEKEIEAGGARVSHAARDIEREAERQRSTLVDVRQNLQDQIHVLGHKVVGDRPAHSGQ